MNYAPQIIDTFKASAVERILVIDDAYDPPKFDVQYGGELLSVLTSEGLRDQVGEDLLSAEDLESAIDALNEGDHDDIAISTAIEALFEVFLDGRDASIDPGGIFDSTKGSALEALEPLLELLHRCSDSPKIVKVGTRKDKAEGEAKRLNPDLIFMDFYLSPTSRTTRDISDSQWADDRKRSIRLMKSILAVLVENVPAVVLMSSEDGADRKKDAYLSRLDDRVMALRFGFLLKGWVTGKGPGLTASGKAADVLMDTSGSFDFGRTLETALKGWKEGAENALRQLYSELREFDIKDFAYLLRFRLYDEGEPFADYLEWFLGESLRAIVDDEVDWATDEFARLNDRSLTQAIEGAHPFPSTRLARFFHRTRFNSRARRPRWRLALGDLFVSSNFRLVRMVVSPDCDLVLREGRHAAKRVLTIGGSIRGLHEDSAWAGELIFHNSPKAIKWDYKDLMTHEFGECSDLDVGGKAYAYFASMRPMSAQSIQKAVLADLSRVGLAVPPTVDVGAPVKVYFKRKVGNQGKVEELEGFGEDARVQVILPRGGNELRRRVLFTSRFFRELMARLEELDEKDLLEAHRSYWRELVEQRDRVRVEMLREGLDLPGEGAFKMVASVGQPKKKSWLEIVVDVSEDALINLYGADPLEP